MKAMYVRRGIYVDAVYRILDMLKLKLIKL